MVKFTPLKKDTIYGYLKILSDSPEVSIRNSSRRKYKYMCSCVCGDIVFIDRNDLVSGHTKSCGCFRVQKKQLPKSESGFNSLLRSYKRSAKDRNLKFELHEEDFKIITKQNCFYCNQIPSQISYGDGETKREHSAYIYNGLDRVDNTENYHHNNVVACCIQCNISKNTLTQKQFETWINKVHTNLKKAYS